MDPQAKLDKIQDLIEEFGEVDGDHHKKWLLDQIMRIIQGSNYRKWVRDYCKGEDGPHTYDWDIGIAP